MTVSRSHARFSPRSPQVLLVLIVLLIALSSAIFAQRGWTGRRGGRSGRSGWQDYQPKGEWETDPAFPRDVFTFARIRYDSAGRGGGGWRGGWGGGRWDTDWPDSDLNFSLRLQQLTSLKVNPQPVILELTDPQLFDFPFIYIIEPGRLMFRDEEVVQLRRYLTNGGFLMVDDFWGEGEWQNFYSELRRVFPDRDVEEVPLSHEIFHCVYDLKEKPQIPSIHQGWEQGITWEYRSDSDTSIVHYRAVKDDDGRIMVFICHNTDLGDGWEREGENARYFAEFSVKKAYPLGINIVTYAMTH